MHSITLQSHIGKDGVLRLQVPDEFKDVDVQVTLALQTHKNGSINLKEEPNQALSIDELEARAQSNGWPPGFFEATYGCLKDDPIERPPQGEYEVRDELL